MEEIGWGLSKEGAMEEVKEEGGRGGRREKERGRGHIRFYT